MSIEKLFDFMGQWPSVQWTARFGKHDRKMREENQGNRRRENTAAQLIWEHRTGKGRGVRFRVLGSLFPKKAEGVWEVYFFLTLARRSSYTLPRRVVYRKIETIHRSEIKKPCAAF
jgi:hypothetical protein